MKVVDYSVTKGNLGKGKAYNDRDDNIGSYQTSATQFPNPEDMTVFVGNGINAEDLQRGWVKPTIRQLPNYDLEPYKQKWTGFRVSDEDSPEGEDLAAEREFRMKDRQTKGLFIRPHIPIER